MGRPKSLEVELETVTPLWLGGAGFQTELRAPSVRGCLRFWLRALLGGVVGDSVPVIKAADVAVYGDLKRSSPVMVRLTGTPRIASPFVEKTDPPLAGLNYMLWTVIQQKRDPILAGERFRMRLSTRHLPLEAVEVAGRKLEMSDSYELALASLWLLVRLGAIGARSRRGGGGLRALAAPDGWPAALPPLVSTAGTPADLATELATGMQQIRAFTRWTGPAPVDPSSYDLLHDNVCSLYLVENTFATWWEALSWIGEKYQAFRVDQREDASGIAALLTRGQLTVRTIARAVFGLPLAFFFKSIHAALVQQGVDPREARRRASATVVPARGLGRGSPLFFRIVPLAGTPGRCTVLMGVFRSRFLPDQELTVRPGDNSIRPVRVATPSTYALITRWFDSVASQGVRLLAVPLKG